MITCAAWPPESGRARGWLQLRGAAGGKPPRWCRSHLSLIVRRRNHPSPVLRLFAETVIAETRALREQPARA